MEPMARLEPLRAPPLLANSPGGGGEEEVEQKAALSDCADPRERRVSNLRGFRDACVSSHALTLPPPSREVTIAACNGIRVRSDP